MDAPSITTNFSAPSVSADAAAFQIPSDTGITVRVVPEVVSVALQFSTGGSPSDAQRDTDGDTGEKNRHHQTTFGPGTRVLHTPYHRVVPASGALVSVSWNVSSPSGGSENSAPPRLVRLTVQSDAPDWDARWVRWVFSPRQAAGGGGSGSDTAAAAAQDLLSSDEQVLTLLLLPGDTRREATLQFSPVLGQTGKTGIRTGDYPFTVLVHDAQTGQLNDQITGLRLRLVHPSTQLLDYLPSRYREAMDTLTRDENPAANYWWKSDVGGSGGSAKNETAPFVDPPFFARYLRGFDDLLEPIQNALGELYTVFGTETTPSEFVPWLAQWVALSLDDNWPELRRRRLIREAVELYRWRGTRKGLTRYLEIYAGVTPVISDQPLRGMTLGPTTRMGDPGPDLKLGHVPPHTFVVLLAHPNPSEISRATVEAIIAAQKPAHTRFTLRILPKQA